MVPRPGLDTRGLDLVPRVTPDVIQDQDRVHPNPEEDLSAAGVIGNLEFFSLEPLTSCNSHDVNFGLLCI